MGKYIVLLWIVLLGMQCKVLGQQPTLRLLHDDRETSIRGLSVVDDRVAWVSGSNGWVGKTVDGGTQWEWMQVPGYAEADFRDVHAFDGEEAVLLSAGSPLVILRTVNAGQSWEEVYRDERAAIFFDGMDFWDGKRGMAYGDPIEGKLQLLETMDGGKHWTDVSNRNNLLLAEGEAGFAASGTGIRTLPDGYVFIATGGAQSRVFVSSDYGQAWQVFPVPILQGTPSTGIFSIAFADAQTGVTVGGDYQNDQYAERVIMITNNGGITWNAPIRGTRGYRSGVEYLGNGRWIATGTGGVDLSRDHGNTWIPVADESYHVVRKARRGNWVLLAGTNGRIATLMD